MFGLQKVGRSYRALTIGGITSLLGAMVLTEVIHSLDGIISYVLYFLSIGAIICGILIPYQVHNELENRVKILENDNSVDDERIYNLHLRIRIIELQEKIKIEEERLRN